MPKKELLEKYAKLAVETGVNVQKGQELIINSSVESKEFARYLTKAAYQAGASNVTVIWNDPYVSKTGYEYMSEETLAEVPEYLVARGQYVVDKGACSISVTSPIPGLNSDLDPKKIQIASIASSKKFKFYREHFMGNHSQWCVVAAANVVWAEKVFPNLKGEEALEALWNAIFEASRVTETNDVVKEWETHNKTLLSHNQILNDYNFESLHFQNSLGTDLVVKLVDNHIWAGGGEHSTKGVYFNPNIPTEENFTMPDKYGVNGKVVASKPLDLQGKLVEDFYLEFKDGAVVNYGAKKEQESLKMLLEFDEGSKRLGEVAILSHNSPISNSNILFYNTLFDENASCHLALGAAYPMNVKGGNDMSKEELEQAHANVSMTHVDFMFGNEDMSIVGTLKDGTKVQIFQNGDFVI